MEFTDEQLKIAAQTLFRVVSSDAIKLRWGAAKRIYLGTELAEGREPIHYRIEWLRDCRDALLDTLIKQGERFNRTWKHDRVSVNDMKDAVLTLLLKFQQR